METVLVCLILLTTLLVLGLFLAVGWMVNRRFQHPKSPYTGLPLRKAEALPSSTKERVFIFLRELHSYDNRPFRFNRASICRETGRLFQDCIDWRGQIKLDWTFLMKRYPGHWVSWGSLPDPLKEKIQARHSSLEGFQTSKSSKEPSPLRVEPIYAYGKPGPLYVDPNTFVVIGWKAVPETEVEVLIVQKPDR